MRWAPLVVAAGLLAILSAMTVGAVGFSEEARRMPIVVGIPTVVLAASQLARESVRAARGQQAPAEDDSGSVRIASTQAPEPSRPQEQGRATAGAAFGWVLLMGLCFWLLGLITTVPVFMSIFAWRYGRERWPVVVVMILVTLGVVYGLFVVLLETQVYGGVLWGRLAG